MTEHNTRVVVIGGGYAGVMAANRLTAARRRRRHAGQPAPGRSSNGSGCTNWWPAPTTPSSTTPRSSAPGIELVVDTADPDRRRAARSVELLAAAPLGYDYLIYAVGSSSVGPGRWLRVPPNSLTP